MNIITKNIPNCITCLNVLSGCIAIIFAFRGEEQIGALPAYQWGFLFIGIAAIADFCDGFMARLLHAYSDLGKELDSLSDLISFGVAPAMLLNQTLSLNGAPEWLCWFSLLIPVAGALRLAKFNIDTRQTTSFIGIPIPANAIFWIGYISLCHQTGEIYGGSVTVFIAILLLSGLMVSELRMFSLKFKTFGLKENLNKWIIIAATVALVVLLGISGLMWLIILYVALSIISNIANKSQD